MNILTAIANIVKNPIVELGTHYTVRNRANNMGEALERYIQDAFSNTLAEENKQKRLEKFDEVFSYQGNQNNPPDLMLKNGDAIEVKKLESVGSGLALNSSYPKAKLFADSPMITTACRNCEDWNEKDILYTVGTVKGGHLSRLFFVYGVDYAASSGVYERIKKVISSGIQSIEGVEFSETKEFGRVNRVDPLGITYLRIRGMWGIDNPAKVFSYVYDPSDKPFNFVAIINTEKYNSFPASDIANLESLVSEDFNISDIKIKTPDNPCVLKSAKMITLNR